MKLLRIVLVVITACMNLKEIHSEKWECPFNCTCNYHPSGEEKVLCPRIDPVLLMADININNFAYIHCAQPLNYTGYELLNGFNIGNVTSVTFDSCPLPNVPYKEIMDVMNVYGVQKLRVQNYNVSNSLLQMHLSGLAHVKRLFLNSLGLTHVPQNLLKDLRNLIMLDLRYNSLKIPEGFFQYVPNLKYLELSANNMSYISPGTFSNLTNLTMLNLWHNNLENLTKDTFNGLSNLEGLDLNSDGLETLGEDIFSELKNIKFMTLHSNNFSYLPDELFQHNKQLLEIRLQDNRQKLKYPRFLSNLTNLQVVQLQRSFLSELPSDAFSGCINITNMTLFRNNITVLPVDLFKDTIKLEELDISENKISHLPDNIFSSLKTIRVIRLGSNQITNINKYVFRGLLTLEVLSLEKNGLEFIAQDAFVGLTNMKEINLSHNKLTFLPARASFSPLVNCRQLRNIYLQNNSISTIFDDWYLTFTTLRRLDLRYNKLSYITVNELNFNSPYAVVDMRHNNIKTISFIDAEALSKAQGAVNHNRNMTVYIGNNPMTCDCNIYHLVEYLQNKIDPEVHMLIQIKPGNLTCAFPPLYSGISVANLKLSKLECGLFSEKFQKDVQCPNQCICYGRPYYDKALVVNCSNVGLTEAPSTLPNVYPNFNHTELWISGNYIHTLPNASLPGYANVTFIDASHNNITSIDVGKLPVKLKVLHLNNNQLTHLEAPVLKFLTNRTQLALEGNPWSCDCDNRDFLSFLQAQFKQVTSLNNVTCAETGIVLAKLTATDICPDSTTLIIITSVTLAVVGVLVGCLAALYYRFQREIKVWLYANNLFLWLVTEEELDKDKIYDAFISYSHKDEDFVVNSLVPGLEDGPQSFKLCLHYRDWLAGEFIPTQIAKSVENSRRTVVVLSPNFLESVWGRMEFRTAHKQALSEGRARVIVLLYGDIGSLDNLDPELKAYLSMNTYVKWGDPWFWDKLRYALPHHSKSKKMVTVNKGISIDKLELVYSSNQTSPTTPPVETIINSILTMKDEKDSAKVNGDVLFSGDLNNGYIKSV